MVNVHEGHRDRMRNRLVNTSIEDFQSHEILEILLYYSIPRIDTNPIAHNLINEFGSLSGVFDADISELIKIKGITMNTAVLLKLIPKLTSVYMTDKRSTESLATSSNVKNFFVHFFWGASKEELRVVGLNDDLTVKAKKLLFDGEINTLSVNIRKIIEFAYSANCDKIILGHNHPNGIAKPSKEDIIVTEELKTSLRRVGITLLDHIIVANDTAVSMYDEGYFNTFDSAR